MARDTLPAARLEEAFVRQARATPDAPALLHEGRCLSYVELDRRSNQMAHYLRSLGAGPEVVVGLLLPRTLDMVIALLGVLKAGSAYLPLDPGHPPQRLAYMLRDSDAPLLLTQSPLGLDPGPATRVVDLDAEATSIGAQPDDPPCVCGSAANLAYIIYTSGSTGRPKGVMLQHSAGSLIEWARATFSTGELARVAATTSLSFDPSVFEIFAPLSLGGAAIIKANAFQPFGADEQPTMLGGPPSILSRLANMGAIPASVQVINLGGEVVRGHLLTELYRASNVRRIYNHYGPSEATTLTTVALMPRRPVATPSIGSPIQGVKVHILDTRGRLCRQGEVGELHIAGVTLARGYVNRPDLTEERFIQDPFCGAGQRMYRTGDFGQYLPGGDIAFLGRSDDQVKLHGIRIELGEIEVALLQLPGVRQAAVLAGDDPGGSPRLVAYLETDEALQARDVRRSLSVWLPQHMIPAAFVSLGRFPLTVAGKVDRAALARAAADQGAGRTVAAFAGRQPARRGMRRTDTDGTALAVYDAWRRTLPDTQDSGGGPDPDVGWAEAGGDSLRSLQLLLRLEASLGCRITFDLISPDITPREMTRRLQAGTGEPEIGAPTLFLVPGLLGDEPILAEFRRSFKVGLRFTVLEPPELSEPGAVLRSLRLTGRCVAEDIMRRQPDGPILLGGYSFGGAVAYEAAAELVAAGRTIGLLVLLDAPLADFALSAAPDRGRWYGRLLVACGRRDLPRKALLAIVNQLGCLTRSRVRRPLLSSFRRAAMLAWRPAAMAVPALVALREHVDAAVQVRWRQLVPLAELVELPAAHRDLFGPASMAVLRPALLQALKKTRLAPAHRSAAVQGALAGSGRMAHLPVP